VAGSDNRLKTPVAASLNQLARQRASDGIQSLPKGIPAQVVSRTNQIVTVAFQMQVGGTGAPFTLVQADYPISTSALDWLPINKGTNGLLLPSDFYLGGISGQGGGTADYSQRGNLATLVFHPITNTSQTIPPGGDTDKRGVYGPNGVVVSDVGGACALTCDKTSGGTWTFNGHTIELASDGIYLDGIKWDSHTHDDPQGGTVGPPHNP